MTNPPWKAGFARTLTASGLLLVPLPVGAQSVVPVELDRETKQPEAVVAAGDSQRLDAAIFVTPVNSGLDDETIPVPGSTVYDLCGDDDGCKLRLVWISDAAGSSGPGRIDSRWFVIKETGTWVASTPGGGNQSNGNLSTLPHQPVFALHVTNPTCRLRDDNGTNSLGIPYQRLELVTDVDPGSVTAFHCLLRIDD